jgi:peroxiredoxin/predicted 2-oxoglutarate/Fe(II)-dependent dioxygenase YbiX
MKAPVPRLLPGDHAPWFHAPALSGSPSYAFSSVAGRHIMMLFFGSAANEQVQSALGTVKQHRNLLDDRQACFFGITVDPQDEQQARIEQQLPGIRFLLDYDGAVSSLYGVMSEGKYGPRWIVLDPSLRHLATFPLSNGEQAFRFLESCLKQPAGDQWAPVLKVPAVLEPDLCRTLIDYYETKGGTESGFMREIGGKTVGLLDAKMKRRKDAIIEDVELKRAVIARLNRRLVPAIARAFQFEATRIERYIVACYQAEEGYFRAHRDNTTKGTAHRKFAVTINLNAGEYEGGDLRFPEFGDRPYRAPTGGAVVFSCSLLHEALPVTSGRRYAFLPFLYDDAGAKVREENARFLESGSEYKATT